MMNTFDVEVIYTDGKFQIMSRVDIDAIQFFLEDSLKAGHIAGLRVYCTNESDRRTYEERVREAIGLL